MTDNSEPAAPRRGFVAELFRGRLDPALLDVRRYDAAPLRMLPEEIEFLSRLEAFCRDEVDSGLIERENRVPDRVITGLQDIGAFAIRIPTRYGGLGLSTHTYHRALMLVSSAHASLGELLAAHQSIGLPQPLLVAGTEEQRREFLPRCSQEISAFALTEPEIGNDPFHVRTTATPDGTGGYVLDGHKTWVTNGTIADLIVVIADVPARPDHSGGLTALIVDAGSPGVSVEHRGTFLGVRGLENGVLRFDRVAIPAGRRIGAEGEGLDVALAAQDTGRLSLPAVCAASTKWSARIAREWCRERVQWGRPIGEHDAVAGKLGFVTSTAFALEAMVEVTGRLLDVDDTDTALDAELAKLFASEMAWRVADDLVQIRGGRGIETAASAVERGERGIPVEQQLRDLRVGRIFDGSTEALRTFLADAILASRAGPLPAQSPTKSDVVPGELLAHISAAAQISSQIDVQLALAVADGDRIDDRRRHLGRIVDIGAEIYAMTAACVYAGVRSDIGASAVELADAFCTAARIRIDTLLRRLDDHGPDDVDRAIARGALRGDHQWLDDGIVDPSTPGPWIAAVPSPGPGARRHIDHPMTAAGVTAP